MACAAFCAALIPKTLVVTSPVFLSIAIDAVPVGLISTDQDDFGTVSVGG